MRSREPSLQQRDDDALAGAPAAPATWAVTASNTLRALLAPRSAAKLRPLAAADVDDAATPRARANGVRRASAAALEPLAPLGFGVR